MTPADWTIYSNGIGGWFAWNGRTRRRIDLVGVGSFSQAVSEFDRRIGDYYGSRGGT